MNRAGEGFLGQVILPLRGLVHNLRPVVIQPTGDRPDHGEGDHGGGEGDHGSGNNDKNKNNNNTDDDDADGGGDDGNSNTGTRSGKHDKRDHDHGRGRDRGRDGEIDNGRSACWRSLRGELCGVFPAADRRGRVSAVAAAGAVGRTSPPLRLRLRLSISLDVKNVSTRERERERERERAREGGGGATGLAKGGKGLGGPDPTQSLSARLDLLSGTGLVLLASLPESPLRVAACVFFWLEVSYRAPVSRLGAAAGPQGPPCLRLGLKRRKRCRVHGGQ